MRRWMAMIAGVALAAGMAGCGMRSKAGDLRDMSNTKVAAMACLLYAEENEGRLPASPADLASHLGADFDLSQIELVAGGKVSDIANPATTVLVRSTRISTSGQRAVAFADGTCVLQPAK